MNGAHTREEAGVAALDLDLKMLVFQAENLVSFKVLRAERIVERARKRCTSGSLDT